MKIFRSIRDVGDYFGRGSSIAIGVFDGVHRGHRKVIEKACLQAAESSRRSAVLTFFPHPMKIVDPKFAAPNLISLDHRIRLIDELGVDAVVVLRFSRHLASIDPHDFVRRFLAGALNAREVSVGSNFMFGKNAGADAKSLKEIAGSYGIDVHIVKPVYGGGKVISSSLIRGLIARGELAKSASLLGRPVSVLGTVVKGRSIARELGFPTANINPHHEVVPPSGVYAVLVRLGSRIFKGVLNIGTRPTFYAPRDAEPNVEVHIFGFSGNIYGRDLEALFISKIREEARFEDIDALRSRIAIDAKKAREILSG